MITDYFIYYIRFIKKICNEKNALLIAVVYKSDINGSADDAD